MKKKSCLISISGHIGTGKTTLAYGLLKAVPELINSTIVDNDQIRRELLQKDLKTTLSANDYSQEVSALVDELMEKKTNEAFKNNFSVINTTGFFTEQHQKRVRDWAFNNGAQFIGIWLVASRSTMEKRITKRLNERATFQNLSLEEGHASDACIGVIDKFGDVPPPASEFWHVINAEKPKNEILSEALDIIKLYSI